MRISVDQCDDISNLPELRLRFSLHQEFSDICRQQDFNSLVRQIHRRHAQHDRVGGFTGRKPEPLPVQNFVRAALCMYCSRSEVSNSAIL